MSQPPTSPAPQAMTQAEPVALTVNDLAQEIRRIDGSHSLGAAALAEALMPYLLAAQPPQPEPPDYPECSGDASSCPENEGFGCCKPSGEQPVAVSDARASFEKDYCGGNKQTTRRNEHGDYVLPSIQDAWSGYSAALASVLRNNVAPIATLHDDGYFTWKGSPLDAPRFAGWRMDVYAAPASQPAQPAEAVKPSPFTVKVHEDGTVWLHFDGGMLCLNNIAEERGPIVGNAMKRAIAATVAAPVESDAKEAKR